jgi:hypothetical protein
MNNKKTMNLSIVLYPRSYNKRGEESMHSVQGLSQDGTVINVKLRINDGMRKIAVPPSIIEFSRVDINAKSACVATDDNSPENRAGVILFSDVTFEKTELSGMKTYIAKWAVVLANKQDQPDPIFSIGRMHLNKSSGSIRKIRDAIMLAQMNKSPPEDIKELELKLKDPGNFSYPVITYSPEKTLTIVPSARDAFVNAVLELASDANGVCVPGVLIRKINADNEVYAGCHEEVFARYLPSKLRYQNPNELAEDAIKICGHWAINTFDGDRLQIFRISKIKSGPVANQFYSETNRLKKLSYYYQNRLGQPAVCNIAIRVTESVTGGFFLYRVYPLGTPLGEPYKLGENRGICYNDIGFKKKSRMIDNERIIGITTSVESTPFSSIINSHCVARERKSGLALKLNKIEPSAYRFNHEEFSSSQDDCNYIFKDQYNQVRSLYTLSCSPAFTSYDDLTGMIEISKSITMHDENSDLLNDISLDDEVMSAEICNLDVIEHIDVPENENPFSEFISFGEDLSDSPSVAESTGISESEQLTKGQELSEEPNANAECGLTASDASPKLPIENETVQQHGIYHFISKIKKQQEIK